ncbi:hypothetical protein [Nitrosopumilus spindle-shaped virus]|uniref:Glycosyltransferase RgtA/B/C/D-like domain-containing protein n=1 Tax=Nitrosopumilus spindle-shaped virus TaxID=2508184 RepID=A0A514K398_9VIRU|nr:hypothetical protein [Nitrosopumilus spindle-shaped virus]
MDLFFKSKNFILINLIIIFSFLIKIYFIDSSITSDGLKYYELSKQFAETNTIQENGYLHNIGFIIFHGLIFKVFNSSYYNHIFLTCIYSSLSLYPAFFFFKKFLNFKYSIFGLLLLAFNFRLIQNTSTGITEPLFLLLVWSALYFSLGSYKNRLLGFLISLFSILIRFEGIVIFVYCIIAYTSLFYKLQYLVLTLFFIPISNISKIVNYKTIESKSFEIFGTIESHVNHETNQLQNFQIIKFEKIINSIVYFGWSLFPEFLLLIPFGFYAIYKKRISKSILIWIFIFSISGLWAYLDAYDTRYFFMTYLFVDLFCLFGLKTVIEKFSKS